MQQTTIGDVKAFWEANPLFAGESAHPVGSREFFEEHRRVIVEDCFAGRFDQRLLPPPRNRDHVLDLGCGPGFWTTEFLLRRAADRVTAADLTETAQQLTRLRLEMYGLRATVTTANAESLPFAGGGFSHVNCLGVIHHTPDTRACVAEIARVLRPGGTATISVYYSNFPLRHWRHFRRLIPLYRGLGIALHGRGREGMALQPEAAEIVRLYDGRDNPMGKSYTKEQFLDLLRPHFQVRRIYYHSFPARAMPLRLPRPVHRLLDRFCPFLIYAGLEKKA